MTRLLFVLLAVVVVLAGPLAGPFTAPVAVGVLVAGRVGARWPQIRDSALGMNTASALGADGGYACRDTATLAARAGACPPPVLAAGRVGARLEWGVDG